MDPKVAYWTAAFANMTVLTSIALYGVRHVRRGEIARHRQAMFTSAALVVMFLLSYPIKLMVLGREDMGTWDSASVWILRFHELCVVTMLVAGGLAIFRGRRIAQTQRVLDDPRAPAASREQIQAHRRVGRIAVAGAVLGCLSAGLVLLGMFSRAG